jgi:hypothetical protein
VKKHRLIAFFVLAYLLTWWIYPFLKVSPLLGIFGLFGPALAAIIVPTWATCRRPIGRTGS